MTTKKHNRHLKSLLAFALALCMVFGACPLAGFVGFVSAEGEPAVRKGVAEKIVPNGWQFFSDGEIQFIGTTIPAIDDATAKPWLGKNNEDISDSITSITVTNKVESIGKKAFRDLKVTAIFIPKEVGTIDSDAFAGSQIKEIFYEGTQIEWQGVFKATVAGLRVYYEHKHSGDVLKHAEPSTCTKEGYEGDKYCSLCGAFFANGGKVSKTPHEWSTEYAYITGEEPTCQKSGYKAHFCVACKTFDYNSRVAVPATGIHDWYVKDTDKFANCEAKPGEHIKMSCHDCTAVSTDTEFQQLTYLCYESATSKTTVDTGKKNYDDLTETQKKLLADRDRIERNQKLYEDTTVVKDTDGKGKHHFVDETVDPTCLDPGQTTITCEWCTGYTKVVPIDPKGHSDVALGEVFNYTIPADCNKQGEEGTRCTVCAAVLSSVVIPNTHTAGYRSGTWETVQEPTCVNDGKQYLRCNVCKEYITEEVLVDGQMTNQYVQKVLPKTPDLHKQSRWFTTLEPTCTENGEQVRICTVKGCPYYSDTEVGAAVVRSSDRKALDLLIAVTKDVDTNHERFYYPQTVPNDQRVYDVANEINMSILGCFQKGLNQGDENAIVQIFTTAVQHHGKYKDGKKDAADFIYDNNVYDVDSDGNTVTTCTGETKNNNRFVFSQIVKRAAKLLVEKDSVILTSDEVADVLEQAWMELGTGVIANAIQAHPDQVAKLTGKSLAKKEIPAIGHNFVRCAYISDNSKFIPVCEFKDESAGSSKWYPIKEYTKKIKANSQKPVLDEDSEPVTGKDNKPVMDEGEPELDELTGKPIFVPVPDTDADEVVGTPVTKIDCVDGPGAMVYQCTNPGCLEQDEPTLVKESKHSFQTLQYPATCDRAGYDVTYCTKCDYRVPLRTEAQLSHNYVERTIKESTCSKAGIKVKICTLCEKVDKSTYQTLSLLPHEDTAVSEPATCLEGGRKGNVCAVCGRFSGEILEPLGHAYTVKVTPPTCTELGYSVSTCSRCGETTAPDNFVAVSGHQFGPALSFPPTCTKGSYTVQECTVCHYTREYNQKDNAIGHQMTTDAQREPTCTVPGATERVYCSRPGCTYVEKEAEPIPATGHTEEIVAALKPTCTAEGHEAYKRCAVCKAELETKTVIPALGHDWQPVAAVSPTCTTNGHKADGEACTRCHTYSVVPTSIPATGHKYGDWKVDSNATPFKSGTKKRTCEACGDTQTESYKLTFWESVVWFLARIFGFPYLIIKNITG